MAGGNLAEPSGSCHQRVWLPAWAGWAAAGREVEGAADLRPPPPSCKSLSEVLGPNGPYLTAQRSREPLGEASSLSHLRGYYFGYFRLRFSFPSILTVNDDDLILNDA